MPTTEILPQPKSYGEGPHRFEPSGFVESCGDGCCREETCAFCRQHDSANPDHEGVRDDE